MFKYIIIIYKIINLNNYLLSSLLIIILFINILILSKRRILLSIYSRFLTIFKII